LKRNQKGSQTAIGYSYGCVASQWVFVDTYKKSIPKQVNFFYICYGATHMTTLRRV